MTVFSQRFFSASFFFGILVVTAVAGYQYGRSKGQAELHSFREEIALEHSRQINEWKKRYEAAVLTANTLEKNLLSERQRHASEKQTLLKRISHATRQFKPSPDAQAEPLPRCVFTVEWMRLYNEAIGMSGTGTSAPAGQSGSASGGRDAADAGLLDSGLEQADIIAHHIDYGERCRNIESQLNGVLDFWEKHYGHH